MKKIIFIIGILLSTHILIAQSTFSKLYSIADSTGWFFPEFKHIEIDNDTIIGYGDAVVLNADSTTNQGVFLYRIDSSGNEIDHTMLFDPLGEPLAIGDSWGNLIATSSGGYAALAATAGRASFLFYKLNDDLSIDFVKEYKDTVNAKNFRHSIAEVTGGYIIWGSVQKPEIHQEARVKYVNYAGEIIWEEIVQRSISTVIPHFEILNDSLFVIAIGHGDGIGNITHYTIEEFNLKQEFSNRWRTVRGRDFVIKNLHKLPSGDLLIFAAEEVDVVFGNIIYSSTLIKLGADYQMKNQILFGFPIRATFANPDPRLRDFLNIGNNIFGVGASLYPIDDINNGISVGVLYNFNSSLDSIWLRNHKVDILPLDGFGNFLEIDTLSSGNLILAGIAKQWTPNKDFGWIMKTLPDGCLTKAKCDYLDVSSVEDLAWNEEINLFPNPVNDNLTVLLPKTQNEMSIQIFNVTGQLIHQVTAEGQYQFSTTEMVDGIYFLKVIDKDKISSTHKFQVIH